MNRNNYKQDDIIDFNKPTEWWTTVIHEAAVAIEHFAVVLSSMSPLVNKLFRQAVDLTPFGKVSGKIRNFVLQAIDLNEAARIKLRQRLSATGGYSFDRGTSLDRRLTDTLIDAFFEKRISHAELIGSASFIVTAGFVTTSDAITCLLWQLARNRSVQDRLRRALVEEGMDADYLTRCLLESIRWHPPVPLGVGRILGEDVQTSSGLVVPKGSFVMPTIYSVHHDPSIWPQPERFNPDRWQNRPKFHPAAFLGFGLGPRNCIGSKLAMQEMKMLVLELLLKYRFDKCAETTDDSSSRAPAMIWTVLDNRIKISVSRLQRDP